SYIDANHPEGLLGTRYFRGSGTSEATAITSGAVALILQRYPTMTPDQVKSFLSTSTDNVLGSNKKVSGFGEIDLGNALGASSASSYTPSFVASTGTGSLEAARGTDHLSRNGVVLQGEKDIFGKSFNASAMATLEANGASWSGGTWNGSTWSGASWSGSTWSGA